MAVARSGTSQVVHRSAEAGAEPVPRLPRQRAEPVHGVAGAAPLGGHGRGQLGDRVDDEVGPPLLDERHQRLGATEGRGAEDTLDEGGHAALRRDGGQVTDHGAERGVGLGPARAHLPGPQTAPARLGGALDSGGDDDVVARSFCSAGDRQEREQVAVRRPRRNQDPHAAHHARAGMPGAGRGPGDPLEIFPRSNTRDIERSALARSAVPAPGSASTGRRRCPSLQAERILMSVSRAWTSVPRDVEGPWPAGRR